MPPSHLLPPEGCQGAVSGWPQLMSALDAIAADPVAVADLQKRFGSAHPVRFGGPVALAAMFAANPAAMSGGSPPADIYAHFVWLAAKVAATTRTIALTLGGVPAMLETAAAQSLDGAALAAEVMKGLVERVDQTKGHIAGLAAQVAGSGDAYRAALARQSAAAQALQQAAADAMTAGPRDPIGVGATGRNVAGNAHDAASAYAAASAAASVTAVLANLETALAAMKTGWDAWRSGLGRLDSASLGKPDYWRNQLAVDRAVSAWAAFALQVRTFLPGLFAIPRRPHPQAA
jgi:hypothetical protein